MPTADDVELAQRLMAIEAARHRAFLDSLTDEMRDYVIVSERLIGAFHRAVQTMFTESNGPLRIRASTYVRDHAIDVGERNREVLQMRVAFESRTPVTPP